MASAAPPPMGLTGLGASGRRANTASPGPARGPAAGQSRRGPRRRLLRACGARTEGSIARAQRGRIMHPVALGGDIARRPRFMPQAAETEAGRAGVGTRGLVPVARTPYRVPCASRRVPRVRGTEQSTRASRLRGGGTRHGRGRLARLERARDRAPWPDGWSAWTCAPRCALRPRGVVGRAGLGAGAAVCHEAMAGRRRGPCPGRKRVPPVARPMGRLAAEAGVDSRADCMQAGGHGQGRRAAARQGGRLAIRGRLSGLSARGHTAGGGRSRQGKQGARTRRQRPMGGGRRRRGFDSRRRAGHEIVVLGGRDGAAAATAAMGGHRQAGMVS